MDLKAADLEGQPRRLFHMDFGAPLNLQLADVVLEVLVREGQAWIPKLQSKEKSHRGQVAVPYSRKPAPHQEGDALWKAHGVVEVEPRESLL